MIDFITVHHSQAIQLPLFGVPGNVFLEIKSLFLDIGQSARIFAQETHHVTKHDLFTSHSFYLGTEHRTIDIRLNSSLVINLQRLRGAVEHLK